MIESSLPTFRDPSNGDRYDILKSLGEESGFGNVYLATRNVELSGQGTPVQTRVALKVIKAGMDSDEALARFEAEGQLLALLHHPNIAKVFKFGELDNGQPFLAMEYIDGIPITEFCDREALTVRERLELFITLCGAVQHAHQKGVIHRDLQPSNVLVSSTDQGSPLLKVIDFGIAKATEPEWAPTMDESSVTKLMGVPQYMSPEQIGGEMDTDTRSDIYSLGVLLYELLTGTMPLGGDTMKSGDLLDLLKQIRLSDPPRPSKFLKSLGIEATAVAHCRSTRSRSLTRTVRGEIDRIVMKALEKDRGRRYDSASAFAADVKHYLNGEPISISPRSWSTVYFARKFIQRHPAGVAAASAVTVLLAMSTFYSYDRFQQARSDQAGIGRQTKALKDKIEIRKVSRAKANTIAGSISDVLETKRKRGETGLVQSVLEEVETYELDDRLPSQLNAATAKWNLGNPQAALDLLQKCLEAGTEDRTPEDAMKLSECHALIGRIYDGLDKRKDAEEAWRRGLRELDSINADGDVRKQDAELLSRARLHGFLGEMEAMRTALQSLSNNDTWSAMTLGAEAARLEAVHYEEEGKADRARSTIDDAIVKLNQAFRRWQQKLPTTTRLQMVKLLSYRAGLTHRTARWPHQLGFVERDISEALNLIERIRILDNSNIRWPLLEAELHQQLANACRDLDVDLKLALQHYGAAERILEHELARIASMGIATRRLELRQDRARAQPHLGEHDEAEVSAAFVKREIDHLERRHSAVPDSQEVLLRLAEARRNLASRTKRDESIEHLEKARELLSSKSMTLPALKLYNRIRIELATHRIADIEQSLSDELKRSLLAEAKSTLEEKNDFGDPGAIIDTIALLDDAREELSDSQSELVDEVTWMLGKRKSRRRSTIAARPVGPGADNAVFQEAWLKSFQGNKNRDLKLLGEAEGMLVNLLSTREPELLWQKELADTYARFGRCYRDLGEWQKSGEYYDRGFDIQSALVEDERNGHKLAELYLGIAFDWMNFGITCLRRGEPFTARIYANRAVETMEELSEEIPWNLRGLYLESLGVAYYHRGMTYWAERDIRGRVTIERAKQDFRQSLRVRMARYYHVPNKGRWSDYLAQSLYSCALVEEHEGDLDAAAATMKEAVKIYENVFHHTGPNAHNPKGKYDLMRLHPWIEYAGSCAELLNKRKRFQDAKDLLTKVSKAGGRSLHEWATILWKNRKGFGDSGALFSLSAARLHLQLGIALAGVSDPSGCIEQLRQVEEILRQSVNDHPLDQAKTMKHVAACPVCHADQQNNNFDREIVEVLGLAVEYFEDAKSDALEHNEVFNDTLKSLQKILEHQHSSLGGNAPNVLGSRNVRALQH